MGTQLTPAGKRVCDWFVDFFERHDAPDIARMEDCQAVVDVVLNMPETSDLLLERLQAALKATLTMFTASDEEWEKVARQVAVRAGLEGNVSE